MWWLTSQENNQGEVSSHWPRRKEENIRYFSMEVEGTIGWYHNLVHIKIKIILLFMNHNCTWTAKKLLLLSFFLYSFWAGSKEKISGWFKLNMEKGGYNPGWLWGRRNHGKEAWCIRVGSLGFVLETIYMAHFNWEMLDLTIKSREMIFGHSMCDVPHCLEMRMWLYV